MLPTHFKFEESRDLMMKWAESPQQAQALRNWMHVVVKAVKHDGLQALGTDCDVERHSPASASASVMVTHCTHTSSQCVGE